MLPYVTFPLFILFFSARHGSFFPVVNHPRATKAGYAKMKNTVAKCPMEMFMKAIN
jgi:hypothetical protein